MLSASRHIVSGVEGPTADSAVKVAVKVMVSDGSIIVNGDYTSLAIYDVVGRKVGSESPCSVPSGVYWVKADKKVFKITVK